MNDKIIVAGGRDFEDYFSVELALERVIASGDEIVSGGARGADTLGERYAEEQNHPLKIFPAEWDKYGNSAGHIRNREMAKYANILVAFWDGKSRGTISMINNAMDAGLEVHVYRY
jgi:hypothetical protein